MSKKPELIYIYDAYCTWCYAFSGVVRQLEAHFGDQFHYTVLSGGMVRGARIAPISAVAPQLEKGFQAVAAHTGIAFDPTTIAQLCQADWPVNSEITGAALTVVKRHRPEAALHFAHALQKSLYEKGQNLSDTATYTTLFADFGLDTEGGLLEMFSEEVRYDTMMEFQTIENWGITGFPCALLKTTDNAYFMIAKGFSPFETVRDIIYKILGPSAS